MFLPTRRVRGVWIALVLLGLTPLSAIAGSPAHKFPRCCVWRVTNAGAPFYLVGSIHALSKKDYPLPSPYELALRESKRIVLEFDQAGTPNSKENSKQRPNIRRDRISARRSTRNFLPGCVKIF